MKISNSRPYAISKRRLAMLVAFLVSINLPYLIAFILTPNGHEFTGIVLSSSDTSTYLSKMGNAKYGFHFINNFTSGESYGGYHFLFYILLGKMALFLGIENIAAYHLNRSVISVFFFLSLYSLLEEFELEERQKDIAAFLVMFGNIYPSISMLIVFNLYDSYNYNFIPDMFASTSAMYFPHFLCLMAFQLIAFKQTLKSGGININSVLKVSFTLLLICLIHPFMGVISGIICGSYLVLDGLKKKTLSFSSLVKLTMLASFPLPYLIYSLHAFTRLPMLIKWQQIGSTRFPSFLVFLYYTGIYTLLMGVFSVLPWAYEKKRMILAIWIDVSIISLMLPLHFQRRLVEGLSIPVLILCGCFLSKRLLKYKRVLVIFAILISSNSLYQSVEPLFIRSDLCYITTQQDQLYGWVEDNVDYSDIILSDMFNGNLIPGLTGKRVALGHHHESADIEMFKSVLKEVESGGDISILSAYNIDYYLLDKRSSKTPTDSPLVEKSFENDHYVLYRIIYQ